MKAVFEEVQEKVPHDPAKVLFAGMSGGAWWSYESTAEVYDKAVGVLAFGGWMSNQYNRDYPRKLKVAMVNGDKDPACDYEEPDGEFLTKKTRAEVKVFHFPGGHDIAPPDKTAEAARWLHEAAGL